MSILSELFGGKRNPQNEANQYLDQIPGAVGQYNNPFIDRGERAGSKLEEALAGLMDDPSGFIDKLMEGYTESGDYKRKKDVLGREIGASAAAGGVAGTPMHQQDMGELVNSLLSSDMQQYLSNVLGVYDKGLSGEKDFYNVGYGASGRQADAVGGALGSKATGAYEDAKTANQNRNNMISSLTNLLGTGVGYALGGPLGGAMGGGLAGPMSGTPYKPWNNPG